MSNDQKKLISLTLEALRPFDLNPRINRNPAYDEIKASIRQRGLEHPPVITRRPDEPFYIIASGGNTRLEILNELWLETRDQKFWNIDCYYQPWDTAKSLDEGNLDCLLGHLIENEKRGALTFIERALGVQSAIDIYRKIHIHFSQNELAMILVQQGYSVSQPTLSVMMSTIRYLLPYIPDQLYGGMSRTTINQLLALRSLAEKFWDAFTEVTSAPSGQPYPLFEDVFALALFHFGDPAAGFSVSQVQDELTGLISEKLNLHYNVVALELDTGAHKRRAFFGAEPVPVLPDISEQRPIELSPTDKRGTEKNSVIEQEAADTDDDGVPPVAEPCLEDSSTGMDEPLPTQPATSSASRKDDLSEITSVDIDSVASLIDQMAWELAERAGLEFLISPTGNGVFDIADPQSGLTNEDKIYWQALAFLAGKLPGSAIIWRQMLIGSPQTPAGFSDATLNTFFQLLGNIRHLYTLQRPEE